MILNIFNNGSQLWVLVLLATAIVGFIMFQAVKTTKEVQKEFPDAKLWQNTLFWFGVVAAVAFICFGIWINSEYK